MIFWQSEAWRYDNRIDWDQVSQDLIGKPEEPARSRHCNSERIRKMPLGKPGKVRRSDELEPGELPD